MDVHGSAESTHHVGSGPRCGRWLGDGDPEAGGTVKHKSREIQPQPVQIFETFTVYVRQLARPTLERLQEKATEDILDEKTRDYKRKVNARRFDDLKLDAAVSDWSGLTLEILDAIAPTGPDEELDLPDLAADGTIPFDRTRVVLQHLELDDAGKERKVPVTLLQYLRRRCYWFEFSDLIVGRAVMLGKLAYAEAERQKKTSSTSPSSEPTSATRETADSVATG